MDDLREIDKLRFPLNTIDDVVGLFEDQLKSDGEPNLALLSIVLGIVEHSLTINKPLDKRPRGRPSFLNINSEGIDQGCTNLISLDIPPVELDDVKVLFELFVKLIKANVDLSLYEHTTFTSANLLKKVSDILWNALTRTFYKDKGHLQFLYTLFNEQKMDCIGMAFGVIAGCQVLGLQDVHLAVTEDHVWAVYGKDSSLTSEITWHGKGTEDRRGNPVTITAPEKSWLYESPMICNRHVEVATLVAGINPVINSTSESLEMALIQKRILWLLYDLKHLDRYPSSLGVLADLEEIHPSTDRKRPSSLKLHNKAIHISETCYNDAYIYPHTYLGNYYYRRRKYREALRSWANAAQVASRFNYNREDDEIYREFNEIANEIMPNIVKTCCAIQEGLTPPTNVILSNRDAEISPSQEPTPVADLNDKAEKDTVNNNTCRDATVGVNHNKSSSEELAQIKSCSRKPDASLLFSVESYADVLRFFDGVCEWEEGSSMPVLHIIWAKNMSYIVSKFFPVARTKLRIYLKDDSKEKETKSDGGADKNSTPSVEKISKKRNKTKELNDNTADGGDNKKVLPSTNISEAVAETVKSAEDGKEQMEEGSDDNNTDIIIAQISLDTQDMETEPNSDSTSHFNNEENPNSDGLRNFLKSNNNVDRTPGSNQIEEHTNKKDSGKTSREELGNQTASIEDKENKVSDVADAKVSEEEKAQLILRSQKMASMKDLLVCERLNLSAIKLLLTAQSHVNAKSTTLLSVRPGPDGGGSGQPPRKRARNE